MRMPGLARNGEVACMHAMPVCLKMGMGEKIDRQAGMGNAHVQRSSEGMGEVFSQPHTPLCPTVTKLVSGFVLF